jgi:hypothetical protein
MKFIQKLVLFPFNLFQRCHLLLNLVVQFFLQCRNYFVLLQNEFVQMDVFLRHVQVLLLEKFELIVTRRGLVGVFWVSCWWLLCRRIWRFFACSLLVPWPVIGVIFFVLSVPFGFSWLKLFVLKATGQKVSSLLGRCFVRRYRHAFFSLPNVDWRVVKIVFGVDRVFGHSYLNVLILRCSDASIKSRSFIKYVFDHLINFSIKLIFYFVLRFFICLFGLWIL